MQSILQYRRFRQTVQAQLEGKKNGFTAGARSQQQNVSGTTKEGDLEMGRDAAGVSPTTGPGPKTFAPVLPGDLSAEEQEKMAKEEGKEQAPRRRGEIEPPMHYHSDDDDDDDDNGNDGYEDEELTQQRSALAHTATRTSTNTAFGRVLTGIHIRRKTTHEGGGGNVFVVGYHGENDPLDPHNWSFLTRLRCTLVVAAIACVVGFASSIDSAAVSQAAAEFGVSKVAASLGSGLFLVGFGCGAVFAGPVSETVGRNPVYIGTLVLYMVFVLAAALAPNFGAWIAFRFIAGVFGSTPLTCAGGSLSDLWSPLERVWAFPIFANAAFTGPLLGPVVGGFVAQADAVSWRWVEWVTLIFSALVLVVVVLTQPETYPPVLLKWKAAHMRHITGDARYRSAMEVRQETFAARLRVALWRPFLLTACEPIIALIALYLTVVYVVLFGFLDGYDYIYGGVYGQSQGITGLCFLGIIIGLCGATALVPTIYAWAKRDLAAIEQRGGDRLPPEFRLWFSMLGGAVAIPVSLFWMGWTARADVSLWSPLAASVLFGYGILCVFITGYQYIIDAYETYAASALASITLIRYVASGAMVVVSIPFYENCGIAYTCTILGCISAVMGEFFFSFFSFLFAQFPRPGLDRG